MLRALSRAHRSSRSRDESGVSAVELAFIAPAFILLIFFTIQGSLYFYGRNVAIQSAREGVSQLRLASTPAQYDVQRAGAVDYTTRFADSLGRESLLDPVATPTYDYAAGRVSMTVQGKVITLIPLLDLTVTETAGGSVEKFQSLDGT